jgi:hypothetical protein
MHHKFLVKKTFCPDNEFLCADGFYCIPSGRFCDRKKDCHDGSDEEECGGKGDLIDICIKNKK